MCPITLLWRPKWTELEFINEIVSRSDCGLLLDVNNVYVNAFNHGYDTHDFIKGLPLKNVEYVHMAGHEQVADDLIIDTHGQDIIPDVYELFNFTLDLIDPKPVLLERDFNIPELADLNKEVNQLQKICDQNWVKSHA